MTMPPTIGPDEMTGPYGAAHRIPPANYSSNRAALDGWIITAPVIWHPLWSQYSLSVITLADVPGMPPAHRQRPDVTHELMVLALDPDYGPYGASRVREGSLIFLTPGIAEQFTATDEQARALAPLCVRAVVDGVLCPETADAPDRIRAAWRQAIHQTLDHDRDPHHGRAN